MPRLNKICLLSRKQQHQDTSSQQATRQIVHLGIGAFHRAHQASYTHHVNQLPNAAIHWNIVGVSLRSADVYEQLAPQNYYYTLVQNDVSGQKRDIVSVISKVLVAPHSPIAVVDTIAHENTEIVSLTVTEKGYCYIPATGMLDVENAHIQHDLAHQDKPKSCIGFLYAGLKKRFETNAKPLTLISCDNLPANGDLLKRVLLKFATSTDKTVASWISQHVSFPCTMVDRIVPATTEEDIKALKLDEGYEDRGMVKTEAFSQWIIENNFASDRPKWERVGATLVKDVAPYENAKLRLLNGAHSSMVYLGYLRGYQYVHELMQDKDFCRYLETLMFNEIAPTIEAPEALDLDDYCKQLLTRFRNPSLKHRTYQIAMDGSQKMPQRIFSTIEERLQQGLDIERLTFSVAGWLRYTMGFDLKGDAIEVQDPFAAELNNVQVKHFYQIDDLIDAYLEMNGIFGKSLRESSVFRDRLHYWLGTILANGVAVALKVLLLETASDLVQEHSEQYKEEVK